VPDQSVASVGTLGVHTVQLAHALGQVGLRHLDDPMVMVRHLAVGMAAPVEALTHLAEEIQPSGAVRIVMINGLAPITAGGDMVVSIDQLDAKGFGHVLSLVQHC